MKIIITLILVLFIFSNTTNACMPFTPELIIVWKYNWLIEWKLPYEMSSKWEFQFIDIENIEKPFSTSYFKTWKHYFIDTWRVDFEGFNIWDTIITISDHNNWDYEDYFQVLEVWRIWCKNNDEFYIENKQWYFKSFWKVLWQCWNYRPDDVMSEEELVEKIKEKYKTCDEVVNNIDNIQNETENINIVEENLVENNKSWFDKLLDFIKSVFSKIF